MTNKYPLSLLKNFFILSLLFAVISCTNDSFMDDVEMINTEVVYSAKSSKSVLLSVSQVSASKTKEGTSVYNVLDGSTSTRWSGYGSSVEFFIDLETESLIDYLNISFPSGSSRVFDFIVYTSTDKSTWTQVKDTRSGGTTTSLEEFDVANSIAQFIKIVFEGSDYNDWNYVSQIEVYGAPGETTSVTTTTDVASSGIVDFGDLEVETSWITEDKNNRTTFDAADVDGESWMDVYSSGIVMMKCLAPESHRTELKEKSGVESSLSTYKKMSYTATLTSIPNHGVTIAQIHNRASGIKRPWIRVYVDADRGIKIKETLTTPWQTTDEGGSTYYEWDEGPTYTSGDEFGIAITTENGEAKFEITANGKMYSVALSPDSDWGDYDSSYYLKAGVYTEGEDKQPQMKLSSFSIDY